MTGMKDAGVQEKRLLEGLRAGLAVKYPTWAQAGLEPLQDVGLAHLHVRLAGTGVLARIPKQSQVGLPPAANLRHQQACFERAQPSGRTPRLLGILAPGAALPRGALLVEEIVGRRAALPGDLEAIAMSLAAVHGLALPPVDARQPLPDAGDPLRELHAEISAQAAHVPAAGLDEEVAVAIRDELQALDALVSQPARPPGCLIAFDAHPGNFLLRHDGRAVLVDLEKCRYGPCSLDLAHASLYTSTTWDLSASAILSPEEVAGFYAAWERASDARLAEACRPWHVPLRRAMWLWSLTWCCKWRALSGQPPRRLEQGEDWSATHSDAVLVRHVRERVDHYLSPPAVSRVRHELQRLPRMLVA
jgi:hypothetical protein